MKTKLNDLLDFETVCKMSLNEVEKYTNMGLINDDMYEAYYHLWFNNIHLMGNHIPCHCGICKRREIKIAKQWNRLWNEDDYYSGGKAGIIIVRESGALTEEFVLEWLNRKGLNTQAITGAPGQFFCEGAHVRITKSGKRAIATMFWGYDV